MATMTKRAQLLSYDGSATYWHDGNNVIDNDDNTYGYYEDRQSTLLYMHVYGYDFSSIPAGSVINNVYVKMKAATGGNSTIRIKSMPYTNGKSGSSKIDYVNIVPKGNTTPAVFTSSVGSWTLSELNQPYNPSSYTGIGFYITNKNGSGSSGRWFQIYYVDTIVDYTPPQYTISTAVSPSGTGSVSGGGTYDSGSTVTLTATPATGYRFVRWSDNNTNATRTVTVSGNVTYTAYFERDSAPEPNITNIVFQPERVAASQYAVVTVTMEDYT